MRAFYSPDLSRAGFGRDREAGDTFLIERLGSEGIDMWRRRMQGA